MPSPRPFALIRTHDQWLRVSHQHTALLDDVVQLAWKDEPPTGGQGEEPFAEPGAGLAFDRHCRLFHSVPNEGRVERWLWAVLDPTEPGAAGLNLFAPEQPSSSGDFHPLSSVNPPLKTPRGLAVDDSDRLFIAEAGTRRFLVYDLWSGRLLRRLPIGGVPLDLVACGNLVYAVVADPPGLLELEARSGPEMLAWPGVIAQPSRIAATPAGQLFILSNAGSAQAAIWRYEQGTATLVQQVQFATDIEFQTGSLRPDARCPANHPILVVSRRPGEEFRRFCLGDNQTDELPPLKARGYDGLGIVREPDGRIGFWTDKGFRHAVAARLTYETEGQVITFRMDSGVFQTNWGRLFLDACIPAQTQIMVRCITADEVPDDAPISRVPPANISAPINQSLSPPMPPQSLGSQLQDATPRPLHRRETGREVPWARREQEDPFETYEAPVIAEPGRYLWVSLELTGTVHTSPRLRALRAEHPGHDYLRRLPKTFSRDPNVAAFLTRFLAMFEGMSGEWEGKADQRAILLNPYSAPAEILPWLAGFLGLTLDERMAYAPRPGTTLDVRRQYIEEAIWLFRFRGTVAGLSRFLEIYLGVKPVIVEKFRLRGLGDPALGQRTGVTSNAILGAGFRVGGATDVDQQQLLAGEVDDAFATCAHRFTVLVPASLTTEQLDVINNILALHRPAHTLVEVCTVGTGMRVGRGLLVGVSAMVGPTGHFQELRTGSFLGRNAILGRPEAGTRPGPSRLGRDSQVG